MTVLIHALGATMGGALRHLTGFLPELGAVDRTRRYRVLVREALPHFATAENVELERIPDRVASEWVSRTLGDVVSLPRRLRHEGISAVVSLTNFGPVWSPIPHIFFQRNPIYYCDYYLARIRGALRLQTALRRRLAVESMKRADLIVTPSDAMAAMIRDRVPRVRERPFRTLYHGFSSETLEASLAGSAESLLSAGDGHRFLYPTHAAPHKGFDVLFRILAQLKAEGTRFRFFTTAPAEDLREHRSFLALHRLEEDVVFLGTVPQEQMGAVYSRCDLMLYPSLCESFGFSMIEAMGYGLPIVAAGTPVNREMCAGGALYYNPLDAREGAAAVRNALRPEINAGLRAGGRERVESFDWSWRRYAREFVTLVESVL